MAKSPKYFTVQPKGNAEKRPHRVLGGANNKGTAAGASMKSASQSAASRSAGTSRSGGPGGGSLSAPARTAPSRGAPTGGGGGDKGNTGMGAQRASPSSPKSPMGGQGASFKSPEAARDANAKAINTSFMDTTRKANEARMATERAKGFGPRAGVDKTAGAITPSTIAAENVLSRIAQGSIVSDAPQLGKTQGRLTPEPRLQAPGHTVKLQQAPTVPADPNRGLGGIQRPAPDIFEGANSPLAQVSEYDRNTYNQPSAAGLAAQGYGQYRNPPAPTTSAYRDAMDRLASTDGIPTPVRLAGAALPRMVESVPAVQRPGFQAGTDIYSGAYRPAGTGVAAAVPPAAQRPGFQAGTDIYANAYRPAPTVSVSNDPQYNPVPFKDPHQAWVDQVEWSAPGSFMMTPAMTEYRMPQARANMDQLYAQVMNSQAPENGDYISPAEGDVTPAISAVTQAEEPYMGSYSPGVQKAMEPIASWAAEKLGTRVAPSQQDSWMGRVDRYLTDKFGTPGPNSPYARAMANAANRSSSDRDFYGPQTPVAPAAPAPVVPTVAPPALQPLPPYVNYQQLPNYSNYGGVAPSPLISDFTRGGYAEGGAALANSGFPPEVMARTLNIAMSMNPNRSDEQRKLQRKMVQGMYEMFGGQGDYYGSRQAAPAPAVPASAPAPSVQQPAASVAPQGGVTQYQLPPASQPIQDFNRNADILARQNQMFRLPQRSGGGVGDGIDAAIRLAKHFAQSAK